MLILCPGWSELIPCADWSVLLPLNERSALKLLQYIYDLHFWPHHPCKFPLFFASVFAMCFMLFQLVMGLCGKSSK